MSFFRTFIICLGLCCSCCLTSWAASAKTLAQLADKANRMDHAEWIQYALSEQTKLLQNTSTADWLRELNKGNKSFSLNNYDSTALSCLPTIYDLVLYDVLYRSSYRYAPSFEAQDSLRNEWKAFHQSHNPLFTTHGDEWTQGVNLAFAYYNKAEYAQYQDYVQRFPHSPFASQIRYYIAQAEQQNIHYSSPSVISSEDSVHIDFSCDNARHIGFELYRLPEHIDDHVAGKMVLVQQQEVTFPDSLSMPFHFDNQSLNLSPLSYGKYFLYVRLPEDKQQVDVRKLEKWQIESNIIYVSDLRYFQLCTGDYDKPYKTTIVVADARNGAPLQSVNALLSYRKNKKSHSKLLKSNAQGEILVDFLDEIVDSWHRVSADIYNYGFRLSKESDAALPQSTLRHPYAQQPYSSLVINTNAAIFRPGDTLSCTIIGSDCYRLDNHLLAGKTVQVNVVFSALYQKIWSEELVLDSMAAATFSFPFTNDMRLGGYKINAVLKKEKNDPSAEPDFLFFPSHSANAYVQLEDYRLPTFILSFDTDNQQLIHNKSRLIGGSAMRMTGLPISADTVSVSLTSQCRQGNTWSEFSFDTIAPIDADGHFSLPLPADWCDSLYADTISHLYGIHLTATLTTREGEQQTTSQYISTGHQMLEPASEDTLDTDSTATLSWTMPHESDAYLIISSRDIVISREWRHFAQGKQQLTFPRPEGKDNYLDATIIYWDRHSARWTQHTKHIDGKHQTMIRIVPQVMRDFITPGARETWTFALLDQDSIPQQGRMMITIIDKAVQQLRHNTFKSLAPRWQKNLTSIFEQSIFPVYYYCDSHIALNALSIPGLFDKYVLRTRNSNDVAFLSMEEDVEEEVFGLGMGKDVKVSGYGMVRKATYAGAAAPDATEYMVGTSDDESMSVIPDDLSQMNLRDGDTRYALYNANLQTDEKGLITLSFLSPHDNTTWDVQAMAWTKNAASATFCRSMQAVRTIMLHLTTPRYLRSGDSIDLGCTLQNAADEKQLVTLIAEIVHPENDSIIFRHEQSLVLNAHAEQLITLPCQTGNYTGQLIVRAYAIDKKGASDGEKRIVDVLPVIEPVREAEPFFLHPADTALLVTLPSAPADASGRKVELMLCDNPIQLVLADLPSQPDTAAITVTQVAHNLYALLLRNYVAARYPLYAQPVDAEPMVQKLLRYRTPKGFRWLDDTRCEPSVYVTMSVLRLLGELYEIDALPVSLISPVEETVRYLDTWAVSYEKELLSSKKKAKRVVDYGHFAEYAAIRAYYHSITPSQKANAIYVAALDSLLPDLSRTHLEPWPGVALTLYRAGRYDQATQIIHSLRQYATTDKRLGMYWNNMADRWWFYRQADVQALFLLAFQRIDPQIDELTALRQWLLLNYQTTQWGNSSLSSFATYALVMGMDSTWIAATPQPEAIQHIALPDTTTSYLVTKNMSSKTGDISSSIAWGALRSWYDAPATSVQSFASKAMSLTRSYQRIDDKGKLHNISAKELLSKGDHVRVTLSLMLDREMDNLTIHDSRPASLEPLSAHSSYIWQPAPRTHVGWYGTVYYQEVRNAETNLYVPHLSKGEHTFTYDCYVTLSGITLSGLADATCMMAEEFTSHTDAVILYTK
ncbi:MAG: hypothetical protein MJZ89_01370 [Paludibacteraceae bacterium]|nr:hypothetical protein [Paludibacteraceae bacterium]